MIKVVFVNDGNYFEDFLFANIRFDIRLYQMESQNISTSKFEMVFCLVSFPFAFKKLMTNI